MATGPPSSHQEQFLCHRPVLSFFYLLLLLCPAHHRSAPDLSPRETAAPHPGVSRVPVACSSPPAAVQIIRNLPLRA